MVMPSFSQKTNAPWEQQLFWFSQAKELQLLVDWTNDILYIREESDTSGCSHWLKAQRPSAIARISVCHIHQVGIQTRLLSWPFAHSSPAHFLYSYFPAQALLLCIFCVSVPLVLLFFVKWLKMSHLRWKGQKNKCATQCCHKLSITQFQK